MDSADRVKQTALAVSGLARGTGGPPVSPPACVHAGGQQPPAFGLELGLKLGPSAILGHQPDGSGSKSSEPVLHNKHLSVSAVS